MISKGILSISLVRRLHSVAKDPTLFSITMGNYELTDHQVVVGEHSGNHFKIILRNVRDGCVISDDVTAVGHQTAEDICKQTSSDVPIQGTYTSHMTSDDVTMFVPQAIAEIGGAGFVNYFGPQRLGMTSTCSTPFSSLVSLAMLRNEHVS